MTAFVEVCRGYLWLAGFGFPLLLMHVCGKEAERSARDYHTGYDDGYNAAVDDEENERKRNESIGRNA